MLISVAVDEKQTIPLLDPVKIVLPGQGSCMVEKSGQVEVKTRLKTFSKYEIFLCFFLEKNKLFLPLNETYFFGLSIYKVKQCIKFRP